MELKEGEYYYCNWVYRRGTEHSIVKILEKTKTSSTDYTVNSLQYSDKSLNTRLTEFPSSNFIREATKQEINWLEKAIKANKYVECPTIEENVLNNLEIW